MAMNTSSQSILMVDSTPLSPLEKVRQTAHYILEGIESYQDSAYYFLIVTHATIMEDISEEHKKLMSVSDIALEIMAKIIAAGQEAGEMAAGDPLGMSAAFFAAIQGLALYKLGVKDFKMPDPEILVNMVKK